MLMISVIYERHAVIRAPCASIFAKRRISNSLVLAHRRHTRIACIIWYHYPLIGQLLLEVFLQCSCRW